MKKFLLYSLTFVALAGSLSGCKNEEDEIFGASAADRLIAAGKDTKEILCSKPNGWVMQYFTIDKEQGYNYLFNFHKSGYVKVAGKNSVIGNKYQEETSTYDMIADNGPVLSFSSYNTIFHCFATPEDIATTPIINEQGYGHNGDYEFIIMDAQPDCILLRGKKYGYESMLTPLPEDYDWEQYLNDMEVKQNTIFSPKIPRFEMITNEGVYYLSHPSFGYLYIVKATEDPVTDTDYYPFCVNLDGMRLGRPFKGGTTEENTSLAIQYFKQAEDGTLVCSDEGQQAVVKAPSAIELMTQSYPIMTLYDDTSNKITKPLMSDNVVRFNMLLANCNEPMAAAWDALAAGIKKYKSTQRISALYWDYNLASDCIVLTIKTNGYSLGYRLNYSVAEDGTITLVNTGEGTSNNANVFYKGCAAISTFLDAFCESSLKAELDAPLSATKAVVTFGNGWACDMTI